MMLCISAGAYAHTLC